MTFLETAGEALYGGHWLGPLSLDMDVAPRTLRRWRAAPETIPGGVRVELIRLISQRRRILLGAMKQVASGMDGHAIAALMSPTE
jgi:hypothetical protein